MCIRDSITTDQLRTAEGGASAANSTLFSADGYQAWSSSPNTLTFLVNSDDVTRGKTNMKGFVEACLSSFALAHGRAPNALFNALDGTNIMLSNPGKSNGCYVSAAPGQYLALQKMSASFDTLAKHGIGITGTFIPHQTATGFSAGFMECGLNASHQLVDRLLTREREQAQTGKWVQHVQAQATAAPHNPAMKLSHVETLQSAANDPQIKSVA